MSGGPADSRWVDDVLEFWFEEVGPDRWFRKDERLDQTIRDRFLELYEMLASAAAADALASPERALAAIVILDQFARNMFRGTARAFVTDPPARDIAAAAIAAGLDQALPRDRRVFFYLPFEHSERLADQERAVALISALGDAEQTRYAEAHRAVIARFGRFPHRNAALGRESTPEEIEFLALPGSSFDNGALRAAP